MDMVDVGWVRKRLVGVVAAGAVAAAVLPSGVGAAGSASAFAETSLDLWSANGPVYAVAGTADRWYLAGEFDQVGPTTGPGVEVDDTSGAPVELTDIDTAVYVAVPDGTGGWYIGGDFTQVDGKFRKGAAQIDGSGKVTEWSPRTDGPVYDIHHDAARGRVVLGGEFTSLRNIPQPYLAVVDDVDGELTGWNPTPDRLVNSLDATADGSTLYVAGRFRDIDGVGRKRVAALDLANDALLSFDGGANAAVSEVELDPSETSVVFAGNFTKVDGTSRPHLARKSTAGALDSGFRPEPDGAVHDLAHSANGSSVFVAGEFTTVGGAARAGVAKVATGDGSARSWDADPGGPVNDLAMTPGGDAVYLAGDFVELGGVERRRFGRVDDTSGAADGWNPSAGDRGLTVAVAGSSVYLGGEFAVLGGVSRSNLAALHAATGAVDASFTTGTDGVVRELLLSEDGSRLFVGGDFETLGVEPRRNLGAVDAATGAVDAVFTPDPNRDVWGLDIDGNDLYAGGEFNRVQGKGTGKVARIDATTGVRDRDFKPKPNRPVYDVKLSDDGSLLYVSGKFTELGGLTRFNVGAVETATAAVTPFAPDDLTSRQAPALEIDVSDDGTIVYAAASGKSGQGGNRVWAWDASTSDPLWDVEGDGDAQAVQYHDGMLYAGHHWRFIDDTIERRRLSAHGAATGSLDPWNPAADSPLGVWDVEVVPAGLLVGGEFHNVGDAPQRGIALLPFG